MQNKYQQALDRICNRCFGDAPKKILQELVNQTKTPTLEEVKKEWEELGYEFIYYGKDYIQEAVARRKNKIKTINFYSDKCFCASSDLYKYAFINSKELYLISKTFKALGWEI